MPSPAAAKILAEKGIDPALVNGTGKDGRITKDDAMKAAAPKAERTAPSTTATTTPAQPKSAPARATGERGERHERMSNLRTPISRRLVPVKNHPSKKGTPS